MNAQDLITTVKDNLGNRASGRIGSRDVDVVVLEALNLALPHIVLEAQPDYYNRTATVSLTTTEQVYDLPTNDEDGKVIRVKDIRGYRCYRSDGTIVPIMQLSYGNFIDRTADYEQAHQRNPTYFSLWGQTNKIHLDSLPSEALTLKLFVETYPVAITSSQLTQPLPIDDQWNIVVEAFATQHCYLKLQQREMYLIWNDLYLKQKAAISREENAKHNKNISASMIGVGKVSDPLHDPMVRRLN